MNRDNVRAVTDALSIYHEAEAAERAARDLVTAAMIHREGVAEAIDILRRAGEVRRDAWWDAFDAARVFGDGIPNGGNPDPSQFA